MNPLFSKLTLGLTLLCSTSGCYTATFYRDPTVLKGEEHEQWTNFYVFGLVGTQDFDVHQFCPNGDIALVKTGGNFTTGLVGVVTIGIYTPRKVYVTCAARGALGRSRALELTVNDRGEPLGAEVAVGAERRALMVSQAGPTSWQLSDRSE